MGGTIGTEFRVGCDMGVCVFYLDLRSDRSIVPFLAIGTVSYRKLGNERGCDDRWGPPCRFVACLAAGLVGMGRNVGNYVAVSATLTRSLANSGRNPLGWASLQERPQNAA